MNHILKLVVLGDMANKNLARAIKKNEKKKQEKAKEKEKEKAKPKAGYRGYRYQPYPPPYNPYGYQGAYPYNHQAPPPPPPPAAGAGYGARQARICSYCKGAGHYFRECPMRPAPAAAMGAPPK